MKNSETGTGKGTGTGTGTGAKRETIRATNWASKLRLDANSDPLDDGICADLDQDSRQDRPAFPQAFPQAPHFGLPSVGESGMPSISGEILAVVRTLMPRAESADIRIRVEIDQFVSGLTAGPIGTILFGMLRRAIDAYGLASAQGESCANAPEITLCARLDGGLVRLHVRDGAQKRNVPSADAAIGLSAATAESLGGSLEICTVPFGHETLLTATIPASRLAYNNENAA